MNVLEDDEMLASLETLYSTLDLPLRILGIEPFGVPVPMQWKPRLSESHLARVADLLATLRTYVIQMGEEAAEYDCREESERLRREATGLLISIRTIQAYFPELAEASGAGSSEWSSGDRTQS